jgi:hypothetical protein
MLLSTNAALARFNFNDHREQRYNGPPNHRAKSFLRRFSQRIHHIHFGGSGGEV